MPDITFQIADFPIVIHSKNRVEIEKILPSFVPFLCHEQPEEKPLVHLFLGRNIEQPDDKPIHVFEWEGTICQIYRQQNGYFVSLRNCESGQTEYMLARSQWSQIEMNFSETDRNSGFFLSYFIMMSFCFASVAYHTLTMHASVIEYQGKALLFLGKSGTGKSTHSSLWLKYVPGAILLNDDNPIVRLMPDGHVMAYGSPWSGKTPCYRNRKVPVCAFVRLRQAPFNKLTRTDSGIKAFATIFPSCSNMVWDAEIHKAVCDTLGKIIPNTNVAVLDCLPDEEAVRLTESLL
jgi:hypothetical protein